MRGLAHAMQSTAEIGIEELSWIDGFLRSVKPYLFVREEDSLLILPPNQAYRLNPTALEILESALGGVPVAEAMGRMASDPAARLDVHRFFCDLRSLVSGCLGEGAGRLAVERTPFRRPFNTLPVLSEIAVTYRCNLRCAFCYASAGDARAEAWQELDAKGIARILETIRWKAKVPSVSFTGGEPAVRADLPDLVREAKGLGLRVNLITNGTLLGRDLVRRLADAGLDSAQVSVEGESAAVHDRLTGVAGSFDSTLKGIANLKDRGITCHTNTTINKLNAEGAPGIVRLAAGLGMTRISMNMAIPCGSLLSRGAGLAVKYSEIGPTVLACRDAARRAGISFLWYSPTPYCVFNPLAERLGNKSCAACDGLLSVAPDGSVLPCSSLMEPVGNILRTEFGEVWHSASAKFWAGKRYADSECRSCGAFEACAGACPIYWRAFGNSEIRGGSESGRIDR